MFDYFRNALPWITIGLFAACSCVTIKAKKGGEEMGSFYKVLSWSPAFCFLFVSIREMYDNDLSSGTTWLVLGRFNAMANFANTMQ